MIDNEALRDFFAISAGSRSGTTDIVTGSQATLAATMRWHPYVAYALMWQAARITAQAQLTRITPLKVSILDLPRERRN